MRPLQIWLNRRAQEDLEETPDGDAESSDIPEISDSVEDLKNRLGRLSDKIDNQFVREQKDIRQMQKRMTVSLSVVMSLTALSILITVFVWFSQKERPINRGGPW